MPTKKGLKKQVIKKKKVIKKKTTKEMPKPIYIITQKLPREKCCTDVKKTGQAYSIPLGFVDRLGTTRLGSENKVTESDKLSSSKEPLKEEPIIIKPISQGRLKIDERVLNKFTQSKQSIPAKMDMPDIIPIKNQLINEYFPAASIVEIPKKKDSKVKKLVTSIEMRRMGQEDALAKQIEEEKKIEETRQRQQAKIDFYKEAEQTKPLMKMTPEQILSEGKKQYDIESIKRLEEQVIQAQQEEASLFIPKRPYVKSGKYSKKNKSIDLVITENEE